MKKQFERPLVMHHLMLLLENEVIWISRSGFASDHNVWIGRSPINSRVPFDLLPAVADLLPRIPQGRFKMADRLTVLLGYPYVQHIILPWQEGLHNLEDWQNYACTTFNAQYGEVLSRKIVVDPEAEYGLPRLVAATDAALIDALQKLARTKKLQLISCMSMLTAAVQRHWDMMENDCVLSLRQQGAFECLIRKQGVWQAIIGVSASPDGTLFDNAAAAAVLAKVGISRENGIPILQVTPFTSRLRQAREDASAIRWLGTAHPWLDDSDSWSCANGLTTYADTPIRLGVNSVHADVVGEVTSISPTNNIFGNKVASHILKYRVMNNVFVESVQYGAWYIEGRLHPFSSSIAIYYYSRAPLSLWD